MAASQDGGNVQETIVFAMLQDMTATGAVISEPP